MDDSKLFQIAEKSGLDEEILNLEDLSRWPATVTLWYKDTLQPLHAKGLGYRFWVRVNVNCFY